MGPGRRCGPAGGLLGGVLWWNTPVTLLKDVAPEEIGAVYVFDRTTGDTLFLQEPEEIGPIVANLRGRTLRREWYSPEYADFRFDLTFFGARGGILEEFRMVSPGALQKGSAYLCDEAEGLCYAYLEERMAGRS